VRNRTKTVTRRLGWDFLKPGDLLMACEKCQGLKRGETVKRLGPIRVVDVEWQSLSDIAREDPITGECSGWKEVKREGFPDLTPWEFVEMFTKANGCGPGVCVTRIEFEYVDGPGL
jgi:hypothetical protein